MKTRKRKAAAVRACPHCGSSDLDASYGPVDPIMAGTNLGLRTCRRCGRHDVPIFFSTESQRKLFEKKRHASHRAADHSEVSSPKPGLTLARMDVGISSAFSILVGGGLFLMGQPLAGGLLAVLGILGVMFFLRR